MISARTGLGVAGLYWDGFRHHPFACEGGHTDFAPRNEIEVELFRYILKKYGHVSSERVLSGPGIKNIYDFLRDTKKAEEPAWLKEQMDKSHDAPALISQMAQEKKAPICEQTFSIFVSLYGAKTGDCALTFMSTGGIFICGIIAARNLSQDAGPGLHGSISEQGTHAGLAGRHAGESRAERRLRDHGRRALYADPEGVWQGEERGGVSSWQLQLRPDMDSNVIALELAEQVPIRLPLVCTRSSLRAGSPLRFARSGRDDIFILRISGTGHSCQCSQSEACRVARYHPTEFAPRTAGC